MEVVDSNITVSNSITLILKDHRNIICFYNLTTICFNSVKIDVLWKNLLLMGYEDDYISIHPCYCFYFNTDEDRKRFEAFLPVIFVYFEHAARLVIYRYVFPIMLCLGLVGNLCALMTFSLSGHFTAPTYSYFKWLAFSDEMMDILSFAFMARRGWDMYYLHSYVHAFYHAHVKGVLGVTFVGASSLLLVAITVNRFIAVCFPHHFKRIVTRSRTKIVILLCFVLPLVFIALPSILEAEVGELRGGFLDDYVSTVMPLYLSPVSRVDRDYDKFKLVIGGVTAMIVHLTLIVLPTITVVTYVRRPMTRYGGSAPAAALPSISYSCRESTLTVGNSCSIEQQMDGEGGAQNISQRSQPRTVRCGTHTSARTQLVLTVFTCVMYITFLTPIIIRAITNAPKPTSFSTLDDIRTYITMTCTSSLILCNSSFNFFIYCAVCRTVRLEFLAILKRIIGLLKEMLAKNCCWKT